MLSTLRIVLKTNILVISLFFFVSCNESSVDQSSTLSSDNIVDTASGKSSEINTKIVDSIVQYGHLDTIDIYKIINSVNGGFHYLHFPLDSLQQLQWSDKIMKRDHLYGAYLISKQHRFHDVYPYIIYTHADDWSHAFFITTNAFGELIDYKQVTDSYGDGTSDEDGNEVVYEDIQYAVMHNDSLFSTYSGQYKKTYETKVEHVQLDSIVEMYRILPSGKIKLVDKDSSRIVR